MKGMEDAEVLSAALAAWPEPMLLLAPGGEVLVRNAEAGKLLGEALLPGVRLQRSGPEHNPAFALEPQRSEPPPGMLQLSDRLVPCKILPLKSPCSESDVLIGWLVLFPTVRNQTDELRQVAQFLDSIVENIPDMIFVKDARDLRFQRFNKAGEQLLGIDREEMIGRNDYDFFPKAQADFFVARDRLTLAGKTVLDIPEEPLETRKGLRWLHTKKIPILDDQGEPVYLLGISADITAQKNAEDALVRINAELEQRVAETVDALRHTQEQLLQSQKMEALGRLAGGVAHDFNNLLTVISGYGEMLIQHPDTTEALQQDLDQVLQAAQRAADLTRQMLAFSRQQFLQPRILYLNDRVAGISKLLQRLIGEDILLKVELEPHPLKILADPGQIDQVIMNLAVNARDAMPQGGTLTITTHNVMLTQAEIRQYPDLTPGPYVRLTLCDTGMGMSQEVQSRVFEPFFTTKATGQGTGLGLATAYGFVKQSLGHIHVESHPGQGSCFIVYLPATQAELPLQEAAAAQVFSAVSQASLLLVEDDLSVCGLLTTVLKKAGYRLLVAHDGQAALKLAQACPDPIDLLVTDLVMPGMGGRSLARRLLQERPGIRIVYMSGYTDDALFQDGKLDEGAAFLHKPFRPDELLSLLAQLCPTPEPAASRSFPGQNV